MASTHSFPAGGAVGAAARSPLDPRKPAAPPVPPEALAQVRRARIELYCGHDVQAVTDIRAAREELCRCGAPPSAVALQALDAASWLARHGRSREAEEALDSVLHRLEAVGRAA